MADTVIDVDCDGYVISGSPVYQIVATCTDKGDLPDKGIFVMLIGEEGDPTTDSFTRFTEPADWDGLPMDRNAAILAGQDYHRSAQMSKRYNDYQLAQEARDAFDDYVNDLVNDYQNFNANFETGGTTTLSFPTASSTELQDLKDAYDTKYTAYQTALTAKNDASDAVTDANGEVSDATTRVTEWQAVEDSMAERSAEMSAAKNALDTLLNTKSWPFAETVKAFILAYTDNHDPIQKLTLSAAGYTDAVASDLGKAVTGGTSGDTGILVAYNNTTRVWWVGLDDPANTFQVGEAITLGAGGVGTGALASTTSDTDLSALSNARGDFANALSTAGTDLSDAGTGVTNHNTLEGTIGGYRAARETELDAARNALTDAQKAHDEAQGDLEAAYDELESAYNAVKAIQPSWVPDNPFPPTP